MADFPSPRVWVDNEISFLGELVLQGPTRLTMQIPDCVMYRDIDNGKQNKPKKYTCRQQQAVGG